MSSSVVYKLPKSHTQVKVQISYQKMTLVEDEVTSRILVELKS